MNPSLKLKEIGITLPPLVTPGANYIPAVRTGNLLFSAGQTPKRPDGSLVFTGKLGSGVDEATGYEAVKLCTVNLLSLLNQFAGGLDNVARIVKVVVFINASPDFTQHAAVANGATDLIVAIFGSENCPARSAVGMGSLPGDAACEVEIIAEIKDASIPPLHE